MSMNGSGTVSVKSGFLTHISSAMTPRTRLSKQSTQSSLARTGQNIFMKYRARSKAVHNTDDIFAAKPRNTAH